MQNHPYLTPGYSPELVSQIRRTVPGMAHWAGSGPADATCGKCVHLEYEKRTYNDSGDVIRVVRSSGCAKFHELAGKHGPPVPPSCAACRYFEKRTDDKS
jgi:hypothetical protein